MPLPDSPTESRRRSRSELRSWFRNSSTERQTNGSSTSEESQRRARSELRGWSSNSSDEDVLGEFRTIPNILPKEPITRPWAFSESSEGSDDSLPYGGGQSSVDSVDSVNGPATVIPEPETPQQRIQRYKEARRRENEARSRRVVEEDARRRKARAEENNNNVSLARLTRACYPNVNLNNVENNNNNNNNKNKNQNILLLTTTRNGVDKSSSKKETSLSVLCRITPPRTTGSSTIDEVITDVDKSSLKKSTLVKVPGNFVRFDEQMNLANAVPNAIQVQHTKTDNSSATERRSRARERRTRERGQAMSIQQSSSVDNQVETLRQRKERLASLSSRIPIPQITPSSGPESIMQTTSIAVQTPKPREPRSPTFSIAPEPCEEVVARLIERCQRVDHYVPVRDKLTLFESLSRLGGRLARSTEDLGRAKAHPSPRGKQRARSLHDLNRAAKSVPVREMCRFFEGDKCTDEVFPPHETTRNRFSDSVQTNSRSRAWSDGNAANPLALPSLTTIATPKTIPTKNGSVSVSPTKSSSRRRQCAK